MANKFKRISKGDLTKPDLYSLEMYDDRGKVTAKGECKISPAEEFRGDYCANFSGTRYTYNDEGVVTNKVSYLDGKFDGEMIDYDDEKKIEDIYTYVKDVKIKWVKKNSADGSIIKMEEYYPDGSRK